VLIRTIVVTPFSQNARVLIDEKTRQALVVDPGGDLPQLEAALRFENELLEVNEIFLTHSHIDHAGGVLKLKKLLEERQTTAPLLLAHRNERQLREMLSDTAAFFGLDPREYDNVPEPERYVDEGESIRVGSDTGELFFTPGHSPGHLSLFFPGGERELEMFPGKREQCSSPILIGGDLIFAGSIGRTDLPGGDFETLVRSVREKIFVLPDETLILSGHGPNTTVGKEKRTNPFFQ